MKHKPIHVVVLAVELDTLQLLQITSMEEANAYTELRRLEFDKLPFDFYISNRYKQNPNGQWQIEYYIELSEE